MKRLFSASMVIARRDYVATVVSKTFLLFLVGPLLALGFAGVLGAVGGQADRAALRPSVAIVGSASDVKPIRDAYARLGGGIGTRALPDLNFVSAKGAPSAQAEALLAAPDKTPAGVLTGWPAAPRLHGPRAGLERVGDSVQLILDDARTDAAFASAGVPRPRVALSRQVLDPVGGGSTNNRHLIARLGQTLLFFLTVLLAGMLLSNLVEEKSNKIIEILAAAVPVDAIFFGKLVAMLGVSLTGIAVWSSLAIAAFVTLLPPDIPLPTPAVGWPTFAVLGVVYYVMNYTLLGAAFLGVGGQANSAREVQTLSLPVTMAQLIVFALASAAVTQPTQTIGIVAAVFPLSSPLAMLSFGAQRTELWPHLVAVAWQGLWVAIIIRLGAARFRATVLKSGGAKPAKRAKRAGSRRLFGQAKSEPVQT